MKLGEKLSKNNFVKLARMIHGNKYDYSKSVYTKAKEKIIITCPIHGDFEQRPLDHILKGCGCLKCKAQKTILTHSYSKEDFLKLSKDKFGDKFDYSKVEYTDYNTPVTIVCPKHGEFITTPHNHVSSNTGCAKCGREKANKTASDTCKEFVNKASKVHFNKYDYSKVEYINSLTKVCIICPEHGEFLLRPALHISGLGCPKCRLVGLTRLYNRLKETFPTLDILFEVNKTKVPWIGIQRLDIYIPKINMAIELMGPLHYEEIPFFKNGCSLEVTLERDNRKRQKCKKHNCTLVELKYYYTKAEFNNLCNIVTKKLEELEKKFYDNESSLKLKDELALLAGKLLVEEILYNTQDNTKSLL